MKTMPSPERTYEELASEAAALQLAILDDGYEPDEFDFTVSPQEHVTIFKHVHELCLKDHNPDRVFFYGLRLHVEYP